MKYLYTGLRHVTDDVKKLNELQRYEKRKKEEKKQKPKEKGGKERGE